MRLLLAILFCCTGALAQSQVAYKAQHGWGLPRLVATPSITQGAVIDPSAKRIVIAEMAGLETTDFTGQNKKVLLEQTGIRGLLGLGTGQNLALAWYRRDTVEANGVWWWFKGVAKLAFETPYSEFALLEFNNLPVLVGVVSKADKTVVVLQVWGKAARVVFETKLNVGALGVNAVTNTIGVVFAEGFRNAQDEKYDLRFLQISGLGSDLKVESVLLAPAVYTGRDQRFGVAIKANRLLPVWWYETPAEQSLAAFTKQHNPRLALFDNGQIIEFAPPASYLGQLGKRLYYSLKNIISSYNLETLETRVELTAPESLSLASLSGDKLMAWQSLQRDGFSSQLWLADSSLPFEPGLIDNLSKIFGWNPWFPWQNLFGQTALSLMLAALAVLMIAPFVWLLRSRFDFGQGVWFGMVFAWVVLLLLRIFGGTAVAPNWIFAPLLNAPWLVVLVGMMLGSLLVFFQRQKLNAIELGATIAASLVVLVSTFVTVFSRVGFLQF